MEALIMTLAIVAIGMMFVVTGTRGIYLLLDRAVSKHDWWAKNITALFFLLLSCVCGISLFLFYARLSQ